MTALGLVLACSCGLADDQVQPRLDRLRGAGAAAEERWPEVFDFTVQPSTMDPQEAEAAAERYAFDPPLDGTGRHLGTVRAPQGDTQLYRIAVIDPTDEGRWECVIEVTDEELPGSVCRSAEEVEAGSAVTNPMGSVGVVWAWGLLVVGDEVDSLVGVTADGQRYTMTPIENVAFVQWRADRGDMRVAALDAEGFELGSVQMDSTM